MTEAEVHKIHTESFYRALKTRNFAKLERLYSERYMLVRSDGSVLNKEQVLKDLRDQGLTFAPIRYRSPMQTSSSGSPSTVKFSPNWPNGKSLRPRNTSQYL
jgi:DNA-binding transcriptional MocR family regulator